MLGRYPMRNRFISDYIQNTTGKYRSAKQVGSRLQQLRDTAEGRERECHLVGAVCVRISVHKFCRVCVCPTSDRCIDALLSYTDGHRHLQCEGSRMPANRIGSIFQPPIFHYILRQLFHSLFFRFYSHPNKSSHASLASTAPSPTHRIPHARLYRHSSTTVALVADGLSFIHVRPTGVQLRSSGFGYSAAYQQYRSHSDLCLTVSCQWQVFVHCSPGRRTRPLGGHRARVCWTLFYFIDWPVPW